MPRSCFFMSCSEISAIDTHNHLGHEISKTFISQKWLKCNRNTLSWAAANRALISLLFLPAMHDGGEKEADRAGRL